MSDRSAIDSWTRRAVIVGVDAVMGPKSGEDRSVKPSPFPLAVARSLKLEDLQQMCANNGVSVPDKASRADILNLLFVRKQGSAAGWADQTEDLYRFVDSVLVPAHPGLLPFQAALIGVPTMGTSVVAGASTRISEAGPARAAPEVAASGSGAAEVDPDITVVPFHAVDLQQAPLPLFTPVPCLKAATDAIASSVRVNEAGLEQCISRVTASAVAPASSSLIKLAAEAQAEVTAQSRKADALLRGLQMVSDTQRAMASVQAQGFSDARAAETRIIQIVLSSQRAVAVGSVEAPANSRLSKEDDLRRPENKARLVMAPMTADTPRRDPCGWMSTDVTLAEAR